MGIIALILSLSIFSLCSETIHKLIFPCKPHMEELRKVNAMAQKRTKISLQRAQDILTGDPSLAFSIISFRLEN